MRLNVNPALTKTVLVAVAWFLLYGAFAANASMLNFADGPARNEVQLAQRLRGSMEWAIIKNRYSWWDRLALQTRISFDSEGMTPQRPKLEMVKVSVNGKPVSFPIATTQEEHEFFTANAPRYADLYARPGKGPDLSLWAPDK